MGKILSKTGAPVRVPDWGTPMRKSFGILVIVAALLAWGVFEQRADAAPRSVRLVQPVPMADLDHERTEAFAELNAIRASMGMPALQENEALKRAAQAHAAYLVRNHLSSHKEQAGKEGFTGTAPMDRALRAGYGARFVGENLSTKSKNAHDAVTGLFSAIYHRFGFLNPAFDEVGIGIAQDRHDPRNSAFVFVMGNSELEQVCAEKSYRGSGRYVYGICADTRHRVDARTYQRARSRVKESSPKILVYPFDGQQEVSPVFYQETPDPLPDYDVSGFPVSVEFNDRYFRKVTLDAFRLYEAGGAEVKPVRILNKSTDPNHELTRRQFALLPLKRLKYGTTYRAEVLYRHHGKRKRLTWAFTTIRPTEPLKIIRKNQETLTLKSGRGYWLYFEPKTPHDLLHTMHYPGDLFVRFLDSNTLRIVLDPGRSDTFDIHGSGRRLHITVE